MHIMLAHDHADKSSLFLYHIESLAIFSLPTSDGETRCRGRGAVVNHKATQLQ